ncbi:MAG: dihydropteroate synthase [Propionibacteriaceae bacterium]
MGVLNVTPDSFSDGGSWFDPEAAATHGRDLLDQGADLVDVGGESTRPGASRPDLTEELRRVLGPIEGLRAAGCAVSVDTMRAEVARAAVEAGAVLVNDVSGGVADERMLEVVAELGVGYVCMHWRGHADVMQERASYSDVVRDVRDDLARRVDACVRAGIATDRIVLDPGIGFAKTADHNWELLRRLDAFDDLGLPLLVAVSRKRFLGTLLADTEGSPRPAQQRDDATVALTAFLAGQRVWGVRTHTVRPHRDAIAVAGRLRG